MYAGYKEEGDMCHDIGCGGTLGYAQVENCSCHVDPPCSRCVENPLVCLKCGFEEEVPEYKMIEVAPGLAIREYKPRQLDKNKIDYKIKMHTGCSQICEGIYPEGTTQGAVRNKVSGTFGGRFDSFGNGKFKFIAYTD